MLGLSLKSAVAASVMSLSLVLASNVSAQEADPVDTPAPASAPATAPATDSNSMHDADAPKDDGLNLEWVWLNADIGYSYADLKSAKLAISPTGGTPISVVDATSSGMVYGFGAGIRLVFLTIGLRARNHTAMNLWQIDAEVGIHGRTGHFDPYLAGRFGYDTVGTLGQSVQVAGSSVTPPDVSVHGWNAGLALGFDYYIVHALSLGIEGSADALFLKRPAATPPALTATQQAAIDGDTSGQLKANYQKLQDAYQASASSIGFGASFTAHVGIHF